MPQLAVPLYSWSQELFGRAARSVVAGFEEYSQFHATPEEAERELTRYLELAAPRLPLDALPHRIPDEAPRADWLDVVVAAPRGDVLWRRDVELRLEYLVWKRGDHWFAWAPATSARALGPSPDQAVAALRKVLLNVLQASGAPLSLAAMLPLLHHRPGRLHRRDVLLETKTLRQIAEREADSEEADQVAQLYDVWQPHRMDAAYEVDREVAWLAQTLQGRSPRSVVVVGPSGVGKTAMVQELVRRRDQFQLGHSAFWATSGARLVAGAIGFGMWQQRCDAFVRRVEQQRAIVHLGNLLELIRVGQSAAQAQNIGGYLAPLLQRGRFLAIAECTPQQLDIVQREQPQLYDAFVRQALVEPGPAACREILRRVAEAGRRRRQVLIEPDALAMIAALHDRYASASALPGRPIRFLKDLLTDYAAPRLARTTAAAGTEVARVTRSQVAQAYVRETGLPDFLIEPDIPLDLAAARRWFVRRLIGQDHAVDLILDVLAAVKAGLSRPGRPLASLLLIGPTGVGKTETAKCLAEFLYRSRDRMTRLDMSEYADPWAVRRLFGGAGGEGAGVLTSKVREQPFSVLLLDELEKAHPDVLDLLLQVLGEARLTDESGQLTDFSNCVILMTSNLGAEDFGRRSAGFQAGDFDREAEDHFQRRVREFLRPELYNRIDRIVPFLPLTPADVRAIARRELDLAARREGLADRDVEWRVDEAVVDWLAEHGFEPRYGARPLKRLIERSVLIPLASQLNQHRGETPLRAVAELDQGRVRVKVQGSVGEKSRNRDSADLQMQLLDALHQASQSRRRLQRILAGPAVLEVVNELERLSRLETRARKNTPEQQFAWNESKARRLRWETMVERLQTLKQRVVDVEDQLALSHHLFTPCDLPMLNEQLQQLAEDAGQAALDLYLRHDPAPDQVAILFFGPRPQVRTLVEGVAAVTSAAAVCTPWAIFPYRPEWDPHPAVSPAAQMVWTCRASAGQEKTGKTACVFRRDSIEALWTEAWLAEGVGAALSLKQRGAAALMEAQQGVHAFRDLPGARGGKKGGWERCLVETTRGPLQRYAPPPRIDRLGAVPLAAPRVKYSYLEAQQCFAARLEIDGASPRLVAAPTLVEAITRSVQAALDASMESELT